MKRYIRSGTSIDEYKGVKIYDDGNIYIYTDRKGQGRMEFPTEEEAREWIDQNMN